VFEGWPDGTYRISDYLEWNIIILSDGLRVGRDRIVRVTRIYGRVVFDGVTGD